MSTAVEFPTASGVWQMTTTKGKEYTPQNLVRLDAEGLVYIGPYKTPRPSCMTLRAGFSGLPETAIG
jgi:hypothetical protein